MLGEPPANAASPIRHPVRASMRPPFFLLAPEGQLASEAREALSAIPELRTVEDLRALQDETGAPLEGDGEGERPAAWVLLAPEVEEGQLAALLEVAARSPKSWRIYLLEKQTGEGVRARPLSLGFPTSVDRLVEAASDEDAPPILELHQVLEAVARARHDFEQPADGGPRRGPASPHGRSRGLRGGRSTPGGPGAARADPGPGGRAPGPQSSKAGGMTVSP